MSRLTLALLLLAPLPAMAQSTVRPTAIIVPACGTPPTSAYATAGTEQKVVMDANGNLCTSITGAVTIANSADVTEGAIADAAATAGGTGTISAKLRNATALLSQIAAATGAVPAAPAVSASGSVTSLALLASPTSTNGGVKYFHAENATTTGGYCILYDGAAAPGTGALTASQVLAFQALPASGYCDWTASNAPIAASVGAVVLISSAATPFTYTTGIVTASIYGLAQ